MERSQSLSKLRKYLAENELSAIIIPSNDNHFGEYIQSRFKVREWLTGFTGSAGTLVVTKESSALWTDSRYFVQAQEQLSGSETELMKMKMEGTPSISQWLLSTLSPSDTVALDRDLFTYMEYIEYQSNLSPIDVELIDDPFDEIWEDRCELNFNTIELLDESITGESVQSKYRRLKEKLSSKGDFAYIVSLCDEIAWFFNLRGSDIEYNPLFCSYAVITNDGINLFCSIESLTDEACDYLSAQNVELHNYSEFTEFLEELHDSYVRIFSSNKVTAKNFICSTETGAEASSDLVIGGTISSMKAVKNSVELSGFQKAFMLDGLAWTKFLYFIDTEKDISQFSEYQLAELLKKYRSECDDYVGESFHPIVAFGANGALPHYSPNANSDVKISGDNFLLIDTGAQYPFGTTDTTRTIPIGELSQEQREDYTMILKGMIALTQATFIKGTRGSQLDILARGPIMQRGKLYMHGTGHGIGHYLCVHEGPQSIRMEENPVPLQPGMVISNEPGVYLPDRYGIRIENVITVTPSLQTEHGEFYAFETLTVVPIDKRPVVQQMLSDEELKWLDEYNSSVFNKLSPSLTQEQREWFSSRYL